MTMRPIGEDDLQGLVDERLDAARWREVEAYLADHPEARARVDRLVDMGDTLLLDGVSDEGKKVATFCGESVLDEGFGFGQGKHGVGHV